MAGHEAHTHAHAHARNIAAVKICESKLLFVKFIDRVGCNLVPAER